MYNTGEYLLRAHMFAERGFTRQRRPCSGAVAAGSGRLLSRESPGDTACLSSRLAVGIYAPAGASRGLFVSVVTHCMQPQRVFEALYTDFPIG